MKVIDPNNTIHTLFFIPRLYIDNVVIFELKNEATKEIIDLDHTYNISNGILQIDFTYTFTNKDKFQIKITQSNEVVYRGKLLITDQNTQDYKITA